MKLKAYAASDVGLVREQNEDNFLIDEQFDLYGVADGMGGHEAGEIASKLALATLTSELGRLSGPCDNRVVMQAVSKANLSVYHWGLEHQIQGGLGTTLTFIFRPQGQQTAWLGHVGDSRAFRVSSGRVVQLTRDHSWIQTQIDAGELTVEEAARHPLRNVVTQSVGFEPSLRGDVKELPLVAGDIFVLASDGLTNKVSSQEIGRTVTELGPKHLEDAPHALIALANSRGGEDNITVVAIECVG